MRRRDVFKLATAVLAAPHIARASREQTLKFVPTPDLTLLDPMFSGNRATKTHALMVFDTLFGLDETLVARPQMVQSYTVEEGGTLWTLILREGLRFHDATPVLARDAVASIQRFAFRDGFGAALMKVTDELSAPDDRTVRFRLKKPFPQLPVALAGSTGLMPVIMPERLANTDPSRSMSEMVGSGPYRFQATEFNAGVHVAYERFRDYVPRSEGIPSYTAGPKVAHLDRVDWQTLGDPATSIAALLRGEVDWVEAPSPDQLPLLRNNSQITAQVKEPTGSIAFMRFNQLFPPFDNAAIRRALLGAMDQADVMTAVAVDRSYWHDRVGLFHPDSPLANDAGIEILSAPRDYDRVKHNLAAAGYRGDPVVVLSVSGNSLISMISQVGTDALRRAGINVDLQVMDVGTLNRRFFSKAAPNKGGWNVFFGIFDILSNVIPPANNLIRGDGEKAPPGWPNSPAFEALREAWLDATDIDTEKRIGREMQMQLWRDVPYIPLGHWVRPTAYRRDIVDIPWGTPLFYGLHRT